MSLERQIRKIMANSVGISEKVQRKMQLKNKTNFDFRLFDPEDSPGSDKANDDMNKEIVKASKMKDKNTAFQHMMKIQKKHSKHGATDTEPREMIRAILDRVFGESVNFEENFMNPDCDICGDGSPCTCGESQEIEEKLDDKDVPGVKKIINKLKGASKKHANQAKSLEKEIQDDVEEDIRNLPKDKQRALQHADKTAKPKSKVSLAPTPGIKTEESNLDEAFEEFFAEGMKVFFVSGSNAEGNVHAKNEKEALAKAKKKGIKGKITIRDKGKAVQPKFVESVNEGYEGEVKKVLDKKGIDAYFKNGKLMVSKRDKATVMKILKGQDFDMPKIQVEEIQMEKNRFGLSVSLVDAVANVLAGKRPVEEKKKMDPVGQEDGDIDNDGDKDDSDEYLMKKRKAIGKAMKKDGGGKEPVDTKPKMDEGKKLPESIGKTPGDKSYYHLQRAKDMAKKDGHDYDKLPKYSRTGPHRDGYQDKAKNEEKIDEKLTQQQKNVRDRLRGMDRKTADRTGHSNVKPSTAPKDSRGAVYRSNRMHKGDDDRHQQQRFVKKGDDDFKKPSQDKLAVRPKKDTSGPRGKLPEDMTDAQMKRREEIVKELKKKSAEFESRYGDKADAVMYATATKMAMKGK